MKQMDIKEFVILNRKERGIKASVISRNTGITKCTISRFETGKNDMKLSDFIKYAEYLGYELKLMVK
jgi:transcriptional regulator with XRE-family HTH domain